MYLKGFDSATRTRTSEEVRIVQTLMDPSIVAFITEPNVFTWGNSPVPYIDHKKGVDPNRPRLDKNFLVDFKPIVTVSDGWTIAIE